MRHTIFTLTLSSVLAASAACTVMVNGKPRRIGGGDDPPAAASGGTTTAAAAGGQGAAPAGANVVAAGEPIKLAAGFVGPLVTQPVAVRYDEIRIYDAGYRECDQGGGAFTTATAPFSFELATAMPGLRMRLEGPKGYSPGAGAVVIKPDGSYVCDDDHSEVRSDWPKGTYKVLMYGQSIGATGVLRFEVPAKSKAAVEAATAALPVIAIGADGATNPAWSTIKPTVSVEAADLGMGCGQDKHARVMPLARLDVKRASTWLLSTRDQATFAISAEQQTCFDIGGDRELAAGSYQLWTTAGLNGEPPAPFELESDDRDRALGFADAEAKPVGDLAEPMTIAGTVRAAQPGYARGYGCNRIARQPDFYLTSNKPMQKVALSILWSKTPQQVHVFGPLGEAEPNNTLRCGGDGGDRGGHAFDVFEGRYAVWIGGDTGAAGEPYHVLVRRTDVPIDPMTTLAPIPTDLALEDRSLKNHYPYFDDDEGLPGWMAAFTQAPDQLFAYPRIAVEDRDITVAAGEPMLVAWSHPGGKTVLYRFDGSSVSVDTKLVTIERPSAVSLPTKFTPRPAGSVSAAISDAGAEDQRAIDAYRKVERRYDDCYYAYMSKHDPTWNHSGQLYKISGSGKITNVGDEASRRASSKCGRSKVDSAGGKLIKALSKTRTARYAAHLAAVRARFGL